MTAGGVLMDADDWAKEIGVLDVAEMEDVEFEEGTTAEVEVLNSPCWNRS